MLSSEAAADKHAEWQENLNRSLSCPDCKEFPPNLVEEFSSGDMVCGSCGLVLGDRIVDTRSEWRTFSNDDQGNDDPSRVGEGDNPLLNGSQLTTSIAFDQGNARSRDLLRAQAKQSHDKKDKSLMAAYKEIGAHCEAVNIPKNISDSAKWIYKACDESREFRNKSQESIIATCIFIACRQANVGRTFKEINALTRVPKKDIGRMFKQMDKFLKDYYATNAKKGELALKCILLLPILTYSLKVLRTSRRAQLLPAQKTCASVIAIISVLRISSMSRSLKGLPRRSPPSGISQVVHRCLSPPLASTWHHLCLETRRLRKILQWSRV